MGGRTSLPDVIQASWMRCERQYGLDPSAALQQPRLTEGEVRHSRERLAASMATSLPIVQRLRELARDSNYCVLFADPGGVVVNGFGDTEHARSLIKRGLAQGTIWQERVVGTNGIGTSMVERRTVTVTGEEHYHAALKPYVCVSTPLIDPDGEALGTLDLSGLPAGRHSEAIFLHQLLDEAASWVQSALFRHRFHDRFLIGLSRSPSIDQHIVRALLALDDSGRICGLSESALTLLGGGSRSRFLQKPISEILDVSLSALESGAGRVQCVGAGKTGVEYVFSFGYPSGGRVSGPQAKRTETAPAHAVPGATMTLDRLAGRDARMRKNVDLACRAAQRGIPILLQGETGTGKDVFAKALHLFSERRERSFVAMNCAAIPDTLMDSELFGYEPGTFTGGLKGGKPGKVAISNHGTLFLDEIGDMPLDVQTRLLRVLAEREVTPLGGVAPLAVDIMLICATHRDLLRMVEAGKFREDLYYRINGAKIVLPPLRERKDIADLVLGIARAEAGPDHPVELAAAAFDCLLAHPWPGNIRQLRNALSLAMLTCDGTRIELDHLPDEIRSARARPPGVNEDISAPPERLVSLCGLRQSLGEAERERIRNALRDCKWLVTEAAHQLGVSRATIHRKMKEYGIVRPDRQ